MDEHELEQAMREGLHRRAEDVDTAAPLVDRARTARRRRRAGRVTIGLAAASVVAVVGTSVVLSGGDNAGRGEPGGRRGRVAAQRVAHGVLARHGRRRPGRLGVGWLADPAGQDPGVLCGRADERSPMGSPGTSCLRAPATSGARSSSPTCASGSTPATSRRRTRRTSGSTRRSTPGPSIWAAAGSRRPSTSTAACSPSAATTPPSAPASLTRPLVERRACPRSTPRRPQDVFPASPAATSPTSRA